MEKKLFGLQATNNTKDDNLMSYIYGNKNNKNIFPPSSFAKSKDDIIEQYNKQIDFSVIPSLGISKIKS